MHDPEENSEIRSLLRQHPGLKSWGNADISEDRAEIPVWEYRAFLQDQDPSLPVDRELYSKNFEIRLFDGTQTVNSVNDYADLMEVPHEAVLKYFEIVHECGGLAWDAAEQTHVETAGTATYMSEVARIWDQTVALYAPRTERN